MFCLYCVGMIGGFGWLFIMWLGVLPVVCFGWVFSCLVSFVVWFACGVFGLLVMIVTFCCM